MSNDHGTPVSKRTLRTIYIGGTLTVGLLTGAGFATLQAVGWDDTWSTPFVAFVNGFLVGTVCSMVSGLLDRRRRRRRDAVPRR